MAYIVLVFLLYIPTWNVKRRSGGERVHLLVLLAFEISSASIPFLTSSIPPLSQGRCDMPDACTYTVLLVSTVTLPFPCIQGLLGSRVAIRWAEGKEFRDKHHSPSL
ncbi:hypothetical protein N656DRAFT_471556 [Canariomyces notabilis]|uniref:Uncharacterized protein n=1 Tax=Canariomyces notabilis TaxID=2074819 RepID=A0AAN6T7K3_9PEZI|nr:hypothetical protein N656DRAFT_471556 [Canariomyces arenarius]